MKKRILSFFCACLLLFTALSFLGTFATEPESGEGNSEEAQALEAAEAAEAEAVEESDADGSAGTSEN